MTRSFCPLPSRTVISLRSKSMSLTRMLQAFEQPDPAAVQERADQQHGAVQMCQQLSHLAAGQDDGYPVRPLGAHDTFEQADVALQHVSIQEEEGAQGLRLRRGTDALVHRQM